jgi:cytidylate kinase
VVAGKVAASLNYEIIDEEVFDDASAVSGIPKDKLLTAFREAPSFFGMSAAIRKRSIAHVSAALAKRFLKDNVVYHGPFGHVLVPSISHVLKVRIIAQRKDRIAAKIEREPNLSETDAEKALLREDKQHVSLAKQVFDVDEDESELFDLVINTSEVDVDAATETILDTAKLKRYQPMTYSIQCIENLELSLRARALLVTDDPDVDVQVENGALRIRTRVRAEGKHRTMREKAQKLKDVKNVEVDVLGDSLSRY